MRPEKTLHSAIYEIVLILKGPDFVNEWHEFAISPSQADVYQYALSTEKEHKNCHLIEIREIGTAEINNVPALENMVLGSRNNAKELTAEKGKFKSYHGITVLYPAPNRALVSYGHSAGLAKRLGVLQELAKGGRKATLAELEAKSSEELDAMLNEAREREKILEDIAQRKDYLEKVLSNDFNEYLARITLLEERLSIGTDLKGSDKYLQTMGEQNLIKENQRLKKQLSAMQREIGKHETLLEEITEEDLPDKYVRRAVNLLVWKAECALQAYQNNYATESDVLECIEKAKVSGKKNKVDIADKMFALEKELGESRKPKQ